MICVPDTDGLRWPRSMRSALPSSMSYKLNSESELGVAIFRHEGVPAHEQSELLIRAQEHLIWNRNNYHHNVILIVTA